MFPPVRASKATPGSVCRCTARCRAGKESGRFLRARDFIFRNPLWIDSEGYVKVPDKPGLGLDLDEEKMAKYEVPERGQLI